MSREARDWAWQQTDVTGNRKVVLLYLAERADPRGFCFPHTRTIGKACGLNDHTACTHLRELARDGKLRRERARRPDGSFAKRVNLWLAMPSGPMRPVERPAADPGRTTGLPRPSQRPSGAGPVEEPSPEPSSEPGGIPPKDQRGKVAELRPRRRRRSYNEAERHG